MQKRILSNSFNAERKRLAHRQRRIIYDNDGGDVAYAGESTPEVILSYRTAHLIDTQVDSQFYCAGSATGRCFYDCRVPDATLATSTYLDRPRNVLADLIQQGTDSIQITADFCRKNGLEFFSSVRMNDNHETNHYLHGAISDFKLKNPQWLFGSLKKDPSAATRNPDECPEPERKKILKYQALLRHFRGYLSPSLRDYIVDSEPVTTYAWSQMDFGVPEVRDFAFRIFEDICSRYDIDGISMDFLRHPPFFKSVAWDHPVNRAETEAMTDLVHRIRIMTEKVGVRRGRPLLLSARVLDSRELNEFHGLDITQWLEDDLIDLLIFGWVQAAPIEEMIELGHKYDKPVYVHLNCGARFGKLGDRARAMHAWNAGADGIYMFNYFPEFQNIENCTWDIFKELGDPRELQKLDKIYSTVPFARTMEFFDRFMSSSRHLINIPLVEPENPKEIQAGHTLRIPYFPVGDNLFWGETEGVATKLELRVLVENIKKANDLKVQINGKQTDEGKLENSTLTLCPTVDLIKQGNNKIEITLRAGDVKTAKVCDIQLHIKYLPKKTPC